MWGGEWPRIQFSISLIGMARMEAEQDSGGIGVAFKLLLSIMLRVLLLAQ